MGRPGRILVVDDEASITDALELILGEHGHEMKVAQSVGEADAALGAGPFDLVFTDLRLPDGSGIELLARVKQDAPETEVILMTAHGSLDLTIEAIKRGAFYYLEKPFTPEQAQVLAARALQFKEVKRENRLLRGTRGADGDDFGFIGNHQKVRQIREVIRTAAPSDASVLIEGESGTGKELVATAFHLQSARAERPFIRINCAAIPSELIESELDRK